MKITFPSVDLDISLPEIEYDYLKFICHETLQTSDEVLRSQLRQLQLPGVPDFNTWRLEQSQVPQLALPEAATTVDVEPIADVPTEVEEAISGEAVSIQEEQSEPPTKAQKKPRSRRSSTAPKRFDPAKRLPDFRDQTLQNAVQIVLAQEGDCSFGTDDLVKQVYGEFTDVELTKARRSLGKVLSNGAKDGLWQRVQDKPPLYQAAADAVQSDFENENGSEAEG
jgi:hypothetical protein